MTNGLMTPDISNPEVQKELFFSMPAAAPGSEQWGLWVATVRNLLYMYHIDPSSVPWITPADADTALVIMAQAQEADPEAYDKAIGVPEEMRGALEEGGVGENTIADLLSYLANPSGNQSILRNIVSDVGILQRQRRYVDTPTPEQFLDEWSTGFARHLTELRQSGALGDPEAEWLMQNSMSFYREYMGELGKRVEAGEDIWEVVGVEGGIERLGERPGEAVEQATVGTERVVSQITEEGGVGGVGAGARAETVEERQRRIQRFAQMEDIYRRPELAVVRALSPLEFLREQMPAKTLISRFQGQKGVAGALRRTEQGPPATQPRRI